MKHYYNEIEPFAVQWLRNLMDAGHIPAGDIDTRSIEDVRPSDLAGYVQCHFFAGIAGWPLALALAGWPTDRPVWTGSCPCQPFSVAGKGNGAADKRHLWPAWFHLISQRRPPVIFGEQVAAAVGHQWLDGVCADLEGQVYGIGAAVLPACSVSAPHRRDRLWFVADTNGPGLGASGREGLHSQWQARALAAQHDGDAMAHASGAGLAQRERERGILQTMGRESQGQDFTHDGRPLGDSNSRTARGNARAVLGEESSTEGEVRSVVDGPSHAGRDGSLADANQLGAFEGRQQRGWEQCGPSRDPWSCHGWINGHDGKARRVEPSIRLLAHGLPGCVGRLRAYGNAIVPQVAAEFIEAYAEARGLMLTQFEAAA